MIEKWKEVRGYEDFYKISNLGRVMLCRFGKEKIGRQCQNNRGYSQIDLKDKYSRNRKVLVHRLVAEAFITNPENKATVNHRDGDKSNNNLENLEWATYSDNHRHAFRTGLKVGKPMGGEKSGMSKLTELQVRKIRSMKQAMPSTTNSDIAKAFSVCQATICFILNRKTWTHI